MSTASAAAAAAPPSSPPMQAGALKKRVQFETTGCITTTTTSSSTSSSSSSRITPVVFAPTPVNAASPLSSPTTGYTSSSAAEVVVSSVVVQGFAHKGHYLCEDCSDEMMEILLGKALEKRSRRVRMKRQLLRDAGAHDQGVVGGGKTSAYNASSVIVETY